MSGFKARLLDDPASWAADMIRLAIREDRGNAAVYLMPDGTWKVVEGYGVRLPEEIGILLPRAAIEAIAVAIAEWQGHTSHADTEARVLREWLAVEQRRVDDALKGRS